VFPGQGERTGFPVDGGDFPDGGAAVHEGVVIDDGPDEGGVVKHYGRIGSRDEFGVGGGARKALGVVLGVAAMDGVGQKVAHGRQEARAGIFLSGGRGSENWRRGERRSEGAKEMLAKRKERTRGNADGRDDTQEQRQQHRDRHEGRSSTQLRPRENTQ